MTQPPVPALAVLLSGDCTGTVPVDSTMLPAPPAAPGVIQAHLSPSSPLTGSSQPPDVRLVAPMGACGKKSVTVSPYSWPPTMLQPSSSPGVFTQPMPQLGPASLMYV